MSDWLFKDCEVEFSSEDDGFRDAWYRGILVDNPTQFGRKKLRIRCMTLLDDDASSPLTEFVNQSLIRPVPPESQYECVVLEEGLVVDADYKDGWWTGVVIKEIEDEKNYLVYFDYPPDIIQFESKQLRAHLHWTGWKWVGPEIKELNKSMFRPGTMVEFSSVTDKGKVSWFPAMMIKEIEVGDEKKFIVKDCDKELNLNGDEARPNTTIDMRRVRPTPPPFSREVYTLMECVEVFRGGLGWCQGFVRRILSEKCYMVSLEATKEESDYRHSDLRPFKVWDDGVWHDGPEQKSVNETPSNIRFKKPMTPKRVTKNVRKSLNPEENGDTFTKTKPVAAIGELQKKRADAVMNDNTHPVVTPQVASIEKESISAVTPSLVITATPLRQQTEAETERQISLQPMKTNTRHKMTEEEISKDNGRKRKREEKHNSCLKETGVDGTCDSSKAVGIDVEETQATDTLMSLPFEKKSPFWKTYERNEEYKRVTQSPHFSPLLEAKEDIREWSAIGMMVSFYGLLEEVKHLQLYVSSSKLSNLSISFAELEKHGFDVAVPQLRINKMLSFRNSLAKKEEDRKCLENIIEDEKMKRDKFEEEMCELERKMMELKRQEAVAKEKKEMSEKTIVEMKSKAENIEKEIEEVVFEFHTTLSAPWP